MGKGNCALGSRVAYWIQSGIQQDLVLETKEMELALIWISCDSATGCLSVEPGVPGDMTGRKVRIRKAR